MNKNIKLSMLAIAAIACTGCASLNSKKVLKAPCGPTAGLTDPCGNSVPINTQKSIDDAQNSLMFSAKNTKV